MGKPWLLLVITLPGPTKAARMRLWRALRAGGAGALRDGVYVLPASVSAVEQFKARAAEVVALGGSAELIAFDPHDQAQQSRLLTLFDRATDYAKLMVRVQALRSLLGSEPDAEAPRRLTVLRREAAALGGIDFFPGPAAEQLEQALSDAEAALAAQFGDDEPLARPGAVARKDKAQYQGRLWVTRAHLWVDRAASAWLIRRFIDPLARFGWLHTPGECPETAIGFDFDGAEFSHVGTRVTFEVLLASFGLHQDPALVRLGNMVHVLDVGGAPVPEAAGLAAIMAGYRARNLEDDALLAGASGVLDALYAGFQCAEDAPP